MTNNIFDQNFAAEASFSTIKGNIFYFSAYKFVFLRANFWPNANFAEYAFNLFVDGYNLRD